MIDQKRAREILEKRMRDNLDWLLKQPRYREFAFFIIDDSAWCATFGDPTRSGRDAQDGVLETYKNLGRQSIGRQLHVLHQLVNPDMAKRTVTEQEAIRLEVAALAMQKEN